MHQAGGSGSKKNDLRSATVRQRGAANLAVATCSSMFGKIAHDHTVPSHDAIRRSLPLGLNATFDTGSSWPLTGSRIGLPVATFHNLAIPSADPVTMRWPSGLNAALETKRS